MRTPPLSLLWKGDKFWKSFANFDIIIDDCFCFLKLYRKSLNFRVFPVFALLTSKSTLRLLVYIKSIQIYVLPIFAEVSKVFKNEGLWSKIRPKMDNFTFFGCFSSFVQNSFYGTFSFEGIQFYMFTNFLQIQQILERKCPLWSIFFLIHKVLFIFICFGYMRLSPGAYFMHILWQISYLLPI